jgi:hypothetical protein
MGLTSKRRVTVTGTVEVRRDRRPPIYVKAEFEKAASLTRNEREKTLLLERAELLAGTPPAPADP